MSLVSFFHSSPLHYFSFSDYPVIITEMFDPWSGVYYHIEKSLTFPGPILYFIKMLLQIAKHTYISSHKGVHSRTE